MHMAERSIAPTTADAGTITSAPVRCPPERPTEASPLQHRLSGDRQFAVESASAMPAPAQAAEPGRAGIPHGLLTTASLAGDAAVRFVSAAAFVHRFVEPDASVALPVQFPQGTARRNSAVSSLSSPAVRTRSSMMVHRVAYAAEPAAAPIATLPRIRSPLAGSSAPMVQAMHQTMNSVQRLPVLSATSRASVPQAQQASVSINDISERVYQMLLRRLSRERERFGG
jgi:hypothetical protein